MMQRRVTFLVCSLALAVSSAVSAQPDAREPIKVGPLKTEARVEVSSLSSQSKGFKRSKPASVVELAPLGKKVSELRAMTAGAEPSVELKPLQTGIGRTVSATHDHAVFGGLLDWEPAENGGLVAAVSFVTPDAIGNRIFIDVAAIHPRTLLVFKDAAGEEVYRVTGVGVLETLSESGENNTRFAGPYIDGSTTTLEILLPEGVGKDSLQLAVPNLSHIFISPYDAGLIPEAAATAGCHVDVGCKPEWEEIGRGVARMVFSDPTDGNTYTCSGNLMNDTQYSFTPNFLTANHCISSQARASTLQTAWFYKKTACNSTTSTAPVWRRGGAKLVFTKAESDTSLLVLNDAPPAGVLYQGWSSRLPTVGMSIGGVHHPGGDVQKVSTGQVSGYWNCESLGNKQVGCTSSYSSNTDHLQVTYSSGTIEPGSSGSGLFEAISGEYYLIGQLHAGSASCPTGGKGYYGRFDLAYTSGMHQWLKPDLGDVSKQPVYRFYNTATGTHFFTANQAERDFVLVTYPALAYEGPAFYAHASGMDEYSQVYRFYNVDTGAHFYTISEQERDYIASTYDNYIYEGGAWFAAVKQVEGTSPLFRFYNTDTGTHFYTINQQERDFIIANYSSFIYEGVAYYAWTQQ